jgi:NAD-dependent deacetylase
MKKLVVLTGAGISAESGLKTFREMGGLWEIYNVMEVASPKGWTNNQKLVLDFYNERRKQLLKAKPNTGHTGLVQLEKYFDVHIITQNVDDLHEKAGSTNVLHLHGYLNKSRSTVDPELIYDIDGWELKLGDTCEKGSQLRPHIVWFGEPVPAIEEAIEISEQADIFMVVGTSMLVYPAAGLIDYVRPGIPIYVIDPNEINVPAGRNIEIIKEKASVGVQQLISRLVHEK